ncbi:MAG TPA: DUF4190 domain-containing protein [Pyrinomonadaceae bacterium]|nr:DUF4190 domain-containing protein [Pyrinomonadaceae bacterium]
MSNIKCPACGIGNRADALNCVMCGCEFPSQNAVSNQAAAFQGAVQTQPNYQGFQPQPAFPQNNYQSAPNYYPQPNQQNYRNNNGFGNNYANNFRNGNQRQTFRPNSEKNGLAIVSLVLACVAFMTTLFLIGILIAPIGLIIGIVALVKIKKQPRIYGGKGMAIAGVVLNGLVVLIIPMIAAIAIPNLLAARRAANESGTIAGIKKIADAEDKVLASGTICDDLPSLIKKGFLDQSFSNGTKFGYRYTISNLPSKGCEIYAVPIQPLGATATGSRSFYYSTEDKVIRAAPKQGKMADKNDLPITSGSTYEEKYSSENDTDGGFFGGGSPDMGKLERNLKIFHGAAMTYQATAGAGKCGSPAELGRNNLISQDLADGVDGGYRFNVTESCEISATPLNGGRTISLDKFGNIRQ